MFEIDGFIIVLHYVRCVYPIEAEKSGMGWFLGFKFSDGFYECFNFKTQKQAKDIRNSLLGAIKEYWGRRPL